MNGAKCMRTTIEGLFKLRLSKGGFDRNFEKIRIVSAGEGRCSASLIVEREHCNVGGVMHGGMTSSLVDVVSTMALLTHDINKPGVSVDMSISFLSSGRCGSELLVSATTLKAGRSLAFLTVDITDTATGVVVATGKHTKFIQ